MLSAKGTTTSMSRRFDGRYVDRNLALSVTGAAPVRLDVRLQSVQQQEGSMFENSVLIDANTSIEAMLESGEVRLYRFDVPVGGRSVVVETHGDLECRGSTHKGGARRLGRTARI